MDQIKKQTIQPWLYSLQFYPNQKCMGIHNAENHGDENHQDHDGVFLDAGTWIWAKRDIFIRTFNSHMIISYFSFDMKMNPSLLVAIDPNPSRFDYNSISDLSRKFKIKNQCLPQKLISLISLSKL